MTKPFKEGWDFDECEFCMSKGEHVKEIAGFYLCGSDECMKLLKEIHEGWDKQHKESKQL